jgi:acyl-CoA thioester hydrolase
MTEFAFDGEVDFSDTDAGGLVHFTSILRWVERAESAWLKSLGVVPFEVFPDGSYHGFPRISVKCDYKVPFLPGEAFRVVLAPKRIGTTSFAYFFKILKNGIISAEGEITIVYARARRGGDFKKLPLPEQLTCLKPQKHISHANIS